MKTVSLFLTAGAAAGLQLSGCASHEVSDSEPGLADTSAKFATAAPVLCADNPTDWCSMGVWPGGVVYYTFADGYPEKDAVRAAMDRWEERAAHIVHFVEDASQTAKATIDVCGSGGSSPGYDGCTTGCTASMCTSNIDHELGHLLGLKHEHSRHDRDHYIRDNFGCDSPNDFGRCSLDDNLADFGPFDYHSTMLYGPHHPDLARWDGSPICPSRNADDTCNVTPAQGPGGYSTAGDGAAIVELYQAGGPWTKFRRTVQGREPSPYDPAQQSPFDDGLGGGVQISSTASPAVESWGGDSLALYIRGNDDNIYKKYRFSGSTDWSDWSSLGRPNSQSGSVSDPGVVSWASGRTDLVVRQGSEVYITSTPSWGNWESLGSPPSPAASAPSVASWGENHLDVMVRGQDDRVYHKSCTSDCVGAQGGWSGWDVLGTATIIGKPTTVARAVGIIDVFAQGMDDQLWGVEFSGGGWGDWYPLNNGGTLQHDNACPDCTSPAVGARDEHSLDIYIRGQDDKVWVTSWSEGGDPWSGYNAIGGVLNSSPATVAKTRDGGHADLFAVMAEEWEAGQIHYGTWWKSR